MMVIDVLVIPSRPVPRLADLDGMYLEYTHLGVELMA
jgi:hypothetical protein